MFSGGICSLIIGAITLIYAKFMVFTPKTHKFTANIRMSILFASWGASFGNLLGSPSTGDITCKLQAGMNQFFGIIILLSILILSIHNLGVARDIRHGGIARHSKLISVGIFIISIIYTVVPYDYYLNTGYSCFISQEAFLLRLIFFYIIVFLTWLFVVILTLLTYSIIRKRESESIETSSESTWADFKIRLGLLPFLFLLIWIFPILHVLRRDIGTNEHNHYVFSVLQTIFSAFQGAIFGIGYFYDRHLVLRNTFSTNHHASWFSKFFYQENKRPDLEEPFVDDFDVVDDEDLENFVLLSKLTDSSADHDELDVASRSSLNINSSLRKKFRKQPNIDSIATISVRTSSTTSMDNSELQGYTVESVAIDSPSSNVFQRPTSMLLDTAPTLENDQHDS